MTALLILAAIALTLAGIADNHHGGGGPNA